MDSWREDRYNEINKALERIQRRADKVARAIQVLSAESHEDAGQQQQQQRQRQRQHPQLQWQLQMQQQRQEQQQQVVNLTSDLARLQDMTDRLFDFRDRLYFYSNLGYVEALNEWQYEIRKICVKAAEFGHPHRQNSGLSRKTHRRSGS